MDCLPLQNTLDNGFYIQWHFTEQCNLRCSHCYQRSYSQPDLEEEKILSIASVIDKTLGKWGKNGRISLTGGEPFLRPDLLISLLDFFENSSNCRWVGILTNGTLIDDSILSDLKQFKKLKEIQISIDGATSETHDSIRGNGNFKKTIEGIHKLKHESFPVAVMFTLHNQNKHDVMSIIDLAVNLNVDYLTIERVTPPNSTSDLYMEPQYIKQIFNQIHNKRLIVKDKSNLKIRISRPLWCLIDKNIGGFCPAGFSSLCILADGTVLPCRRLEIPLGNVLRDGLFKIWYTSDVLWELRDKMLLKGKCRECSHLGNCGGCRAIAYTVSGDYLASDPQCWK